MKIEFLAKYLNLDCPNPDQSINQFCIDSRLVTSRDVFIAFKGAHLDGRDFIAEAIQKGAIAIIYENDGGDYELPVTSKKVAILGVQDCRLALQGLAKAWLETIQPAIFAVTGSTGKTTVKNILFSILSQCGPTIASKGNFNNELGLPLTILRLNASHKYLVLEMGASALGNIQQLCSIAAPDIALVNNVMPAHLEGFGSLDNIAIAKSEIYQYAKPNATVVIDASSPYGPIFEQAAHSRNKIYFASNSNTEAENKVSEVCFTPEGMNFSLHLGINQSEICLSLMGTHNVKNALAAATMAYASGIEFCKIVSGLKQVKPEKARLNSQKGLKGAHIIDDTYNATPGAVQAAVSVLTQLPGEKILVMGDMLELGKDAAKYHQEIGNFAKQQGVNKLLAVGEFKHELAKGFGENAMVFANKPSLVASLRGVLSENTVVLVKGSRGTKMEEVLKQLMTQES